MAAPNPGDYPDFVQYLQALQEYQNSPEAKAALSSAGGILPTDADGDGEISQSEMAEWDKGETVAGVSGNPVGEITGENAAAEANKQRDKDLAAMEQQRDEGQQFLESQAAKGEGFIDAATSRASGALNKGFAGATDAFGAANKASLGSLASGYAQAGGAIGQGFQGGLGSLAQGFSQGRGDLAGMVGKGPGAYDALSQQPGRLADLYDGGLARDFQASPGYQQRLAASEQALNRSAAAQGGRLGGRQIAALQSNAQNMASNEWGNYVQQRTGLAGAADQQNLSALFNQAGRNDAAGMAGYQGNLGLAGQMAGMSAQGGQALGDMQAQQGAALGNLYQQQGAQNAGYQSQYGQQMGGLAQQQGASLGDLYMGGATTKANNAVGVGGNNANLAAGMMSGIGNSQSYQAPSLLQQAAPLASMYLGARAGAA